MSDSALHGDFDTALVHEGLLPIIHHYHHYESHEPTLTIRGERNTKGWNVEIGVSGARSVEEAVKLLDELKTQAEARFGGGVV